MVLGLPQRRRQVHVQARLATRVYFLPIAFWLPFLITDPPFRFVLKTKEQRAAEKALMDKSPLKTLTLEDFLESERHKLTGTLTPVNPETFAKWKKDRLDKKAAEEQAKKAKDATGRALFESGNWKGDDSEADSDSDDDDNDDIWNLEKLRKETEAARQQKEEERLLALHGGTLEAGPSGTPNDASDEPSGS